MTDQRASEGVPHPGSVGKAVGCAAFVLFAVVLEVVSGQAANSENPGWVYGLVPLTCSPPARVTWWLLVAAAAWPDFRRSRAHAGLIGSIVAGQGPERGPAT